jgi:hypothetical protein
VTEASERGKRGRESRLLGRKGGAGTSLHAGVHFGRDGWKPLEHGCLRGVAYACMVFDEKRASGWRPGRAGEGAARAVLWQE